MSVETERYVGPGEPSWTRPTRLSGAVYAAKVVAFRARRALVNATSGPPRLSRAGLEGLDEVAAESRTPLWSDEARAERAFQLGKIHNLRVACRALDGVVIPAGAVFSFWRQVGPPFASRGFVRGRMLQEGCMVAAVGGGLCQLSNALYEAALQAGCRIVERHPHSRIVPGSAAARGRDATVAWNYVDLRFAPDRALRISARLDRDSLAIRFLGAAGDTAPRRPDTRRAFAPGAAAPFLPRSCGTCEETDCHLHEPGRGKTARPARVQAFLVDEAWPELRAYVQATRQSQDRLGRPLDGGRLGVGRYDWNAQGFDRAASAPLAALGRSLALRGAGRSGAAARRAELASAERVAGALARLLTFDVDAVTVAQSYLPFLWRDGRLGGREVSVLMTRLPMAEIQVRLDAAAASRPECATLADFRAPSWLVQAETEALAASARIITPHAAVAALFGERAVKTAWEIPPGRPRAAGEPRGRIAFPGPTAARKGAYAVRDAAIALDLEVAPLGSELEGADFWRGVRLAPHGDWTAVDAVVQPAIVEHQPRRLLAALAAGAPVIATEACGLDPRPGLMLIPPDDSDALIAALRDILAQRTL